MSDTLHIRFEADMPPATVEVISPDYEIVGRVLLEPGRLADVDVPSSEVFLRVHLPSGQTFNLHDPNTLDRRINLERLREQTSGRDVRKHSQIHLEGFSEI